MDFNKRLEYIPCNIPIHKKFLRYKDFNDWYTKFTWSIHQDGISEQEKLAQKYMAAKLLCQELLKVKLLKIDVHKQFLLFKTYISNTHDIQKKIYKTEKFANTIFGRIYEQAAIDIFNAYNIDCNFANGDSDVITLDLNASNNFGKTFDIYCDGYGFDVKTVSTIYKDSFPFIKGSFYNTGLTKKKVVQMHEYGKNKNHHHINNFKNACFLLFAVDNFHDTVDNNEVYIFKTYDILDFCLYNKQVTGISEVNIGNKNVLQIESNSPWLMKIDDFIKEYLNKATSSKN